MTLSRDALLTYLRNADSSTALSFATENIRELFRVRHCCFHWHYAETGRFVAGTFTTHWKERYRARGYARIDPVLLGSVRRFAPVNWKDLDWSAKPARDMLRDVRDRGLGGQGYSLPHHGPRGQFTLLTLTQECDDDGWAEFIAGHRAELTLLAHTMSVLAIGLEARANLPSEPGLSPRERTAIRCLALGMNRAQAAREMGISEHTLRAYIEGARNKLGAQNTIHAVSRALSSRVVVV